MIQTKYKLLNGFVLAIFLALVCGFQSSFWYQVTGGVPAPQLWMLVILYLALYRSFFVAMGMVYGLALILKAFSATPLGVLWVTLFVMVSLSSFIKSRFFWPSNRYFVIASTLFIFVFNILFLIISKLTEDSSVGFSFFTHFVEIALTTLFATPMYWLLLKLDEWTLPEMGDSQGVTE